MRGRVEKLLGTGGRRVGGHVKTPLFLAAWKCGVPVEEGQVSGPTAQSQPPLSFLNQFLLRQ